MVSCEQALKREIENGNLNLYALISPPRTGSTALGQYLGRRVFDGVFTEPAAIMEDPERRIEGAMERLFNYYKSLLVQQKRNPLNILFKEISLHVGPGQEAEDLFGLAKKIVFLVRNPIIALESYILLRANIIDWAGIGPKTLADFCDWVRPETSLDHIKNSSDISAWKQHVFYMKKNRDYSSLTERITTNSILLSCKSLQRDVWNYAKTLLTTPDVRAHEYGYPSWDVMTENFLGTPIKKIVATSNSSRLSFERKDSIPSVLCNPFAYRTEGWISLEEHYDRFAHRDGCAGVVDFTDMQMFPESCGSELAVRMGLEESMEKTASNFISGYPPEKEEILFGRAKLTDRIAPPSVSPISPEKFPPFLLGHLEKAFQVYLTLLAAPGRIRANGYPLLLQMEKPIVAGKTIQDVDPVYCYACAAADTLLPERDRSSIFSTIQKASPRFQSYFEIIDRTALRGAPSATVFSRNFGGHHMEPPSPTP